MSQSNKSNPGTSCKNESANTPTPNYRPPTPAPEKTSSNNSSQK